MSNSIVETATEVASEDETGYREPSEYEAPRRDDSSEEEDDDDEEEAARIRDGFIVDEEEEEDEESDSESRKRRKKERKKKRREKRKRSLAEQQLSDSDDELDDLDDIIEGSSKTKFKRLKQGHGRRGSFEEDSDDDIFDDTGERTAVARTGGYGDDLEDFIEDDDSDADNFRDDTSRSRSGAAARPAGMGSLEASGLDEATYEDMLQAFGDGNDYLWALQEQERMEAIDEGAQLDLELKDVFEPSQLQEKMLTEEDNLIRSTDVPERLQLLRKPFKDDSSIPTHSRDLRRHAEARWITKILQSRRGFGSSVPEKPLEQAVAKVLEFINEQDLEVPFIFQHRKDYLIYAPKKGDHNSRSFDEENAIRLLDQADLWDILELDPKFRTMLEKVDGLQDAYEMIKSKIPGGEDDVFEDLIGAIDEVEEVQDLYDHLSCQYPSLMQEHSSSLAENTGGQKRAKAGRPKWETIRQSPVYELVKAIGLTADQFARQVTGAGRRQYTEDSSERPEDMADRLLDPPEHATGSEVLRAGLAMYIEELVTSPRLRRYLRSVFYRDGVINSHRTDKGARLINEGDRYYEFKYLKNKPFAWAASAPHKFLRMLQAESEGLLTVEVGVRDRTDLIHGLVNQLVSDNVSEIADSWNSLRRKAVETAFGRLEQFISRSVKERVKAECLGVLSKSCRQRFTRRLDQAPFKPPGLVHGTCPRVLAFTNGNGGMDAIVWAVVEDDGRCTKYGKMIDLRPGNPERNIPDGKNVADFIKLVKDVVPDVIAVGGFNVSAKRLHRNIQELLVAHESEVERFLDEDDENGRPRSVPIEAMIVNDECARLFHTSPRAERELSGLTSLARYCVGLARYMQSPLLEYAALGRDVTSLSLDPDQDLVPRDKLYRVLETAIVDIVNMVGVEVNEAVVNERIGRLLPFVAGLGPRKAAQLVKIVTLNGGIVGHRAELLGDPEVNIMQVVGPRVFTNCASFLFIDFEDPHKKRRGDRGLVGDDMDDDNLQPVSDFLDSTRVHPEDYDLARKMAADALELDEEDIQAEMDENGPGAVVHKLVSENAQDRVNDLVLSEYAEQLFRTFSQLKRATLETIRAELLNPYEEIRQPFQPRTAEEILTMLTGETVDSLRPDTTQSVKIRRIFQSHIDVSLSCGIDGSIPEHEFPDRVGGSRGVDPRQVYSPHQVVLASIVQLNLRQLSATLSLNETRIKSPIVLSVSRHPDEWDMDLEESDKAAVVRAKEAISGRPQRVINHPLFRPFTYPQAEEYLGTQSRGDLVIRPSSRGLDHLTVTWKVSDNVYQHIDVLELNKENEFSLGKVLKIGGKYTYSDLDELIVNHVNAMAKKVDEMMHDEKFSNLSKQQTEERLVRYTQANPGMIDYAFCINPKYSGYFYLCFKAGRDAPTGSWTVKVLPGAFELQRNQYPDMRSLKNGFKLLFTLMTSNRQGRR